MNTCGECPHIYRDDRPAGAGICCWAPPAETEGAKFEVKDHRPACRVMTNHSRDRERWLLGAAQAVLAKLNRDDGASATGEFAKALGRLERVVADYETNDTDTNPRGE